MESLFINAIVGFWLVVFGAAAIFPVFMESTSSKRKSPVIADDQVLSIQPVATGATLTSITRHPAYQPDSDQPQAA